MPLVCKLGLPQPIVVVIVLILVMLSYQLIIPMMLKYLPYVTAQKDVFNVSKFLERQSGIDDVKRN